MEVEVGTVGCIMKSYLSAHMRVGRWGEGWISRKPEQLSLMKTNLSGHVVLMRVYVVGS